MTIAQDILQPVVPAYIELFEIDLSKTNIPELAGTIFRCTNSEVSYSGILFGESTYIPFPIEITGISQTSTGAPPRPQLNIANINKYFGSLAFKYNDIIGANVVYIRTFEPYLNLVSRLSLPPMKFQIAKKLSHNKHGLSFELRSPLDKERAVMPKNQMLKRDYPGLGVNKRV